MASLEPTQVRLGLSKEREVIKQLKINKLWREDKEGPYVALQFDGMEFRFRPGKVLTLGKSVANALYRSSQILIGPDYLNGPISTFLVKQGEFELGQEAAEEPKVSPTTCPICHEDQLTLPRLTRHLMSKHKDDPRMIETDEEEQNAKAAEGSEIDGADDTEGVGADSQSAGE